MPRDEEPFHLDSVTCLSETDKAVLVTCPDFEADEEEVWVPKSVILDDSEVFETGGEGVLIVAGWWARKQGWC